MKCRYMVALTWIRKLTPEMRRWIPAKINFANNHKCEPEESDEDDVKDIANGFSAVEKTVTPIVKKWVL